MRALSVFGGGLLVMACQTGPDGPPGEGTRGPDGAEGPPGSDATSSLASITPATAFLGRQLDVAISGSNTQWSQQSPPQVAFGADGPDEVATVGVTVHSPTSLTATIIVPPTAAIGLRDVTVTDGDSAARIDGAFSVDPSLEVQVLGAGSQSLGHLKQGSVVQLNVFQKDLTTPFDWQPENVTARVGDVTTFHPNGPTTASYGFQTFMRIDVKAEPGSYGLVVDSGPEGAVVRSSTPVPFLTLEKRSPTPIFPGSNLSSLPNPGESLLYRMSVDKDEIVSFTVSGSNSEATADLVVLPASGRFSDERTNSAKFGAGPIHFQALVQPPEAFLIYRGFGDHAEPHIGIDVAEELLDAALADTIAPGASVDGSVTLGDSVWYKLVVDQPGQLTLEVQPRLDYVCGSPSLQPGDKPVDSELQLTDLEGRNLLTSEDIAGDNWCSALSFEVEVGTYYARVASSQRRTPAGEFPFTLGSTLQ